MNIPEVRDFDGARAAAELRRQGFTAVDDIAESLYQYAEEELLEALGLEADVIDLVTSRIDSDLGPVFVFRDRRRVALKDVRAVVKRERKAG